VSVGTVRGLSLTSGDFLDFKFLLDFNMVGKSRNCHDSIGACHYVHTRDPAS